MMENGKARKSVKRHLVMHFLHVLFDVLRRVDDCVVKDCFVLTPVKLGLEDCGRVCVATACGGHLPQAESHAHGIPHTVAEVDFQLRLRLSCLIFSYFEATFLLNLLLGQDFHSCTVNALQGKSRWCPNLAYGEVRSLFFLARFHWHFKFQKFSILIIIIYLGHESMIIRESCSPESPLS